MRPIPSSPFPSGGRDPAWPKPFPTTTAASSSPTRTTIPLSSSSSVLMANSIPSTPSIPRDLSCPSRQSVKALLLGGADQPLTTCPRLHPARGPSLSFRWRPVVRPTARPVRPRFEIASPATRSSCTESLAADSPCARLQATSLCLRRSTCLTPALTFMSRLMILQFPAAWATSSVLRLGQAGGLRCSTALCHSVPACTLRAWPAIRPAPTCTSPIMRVRMCSGTQVQALSGSLYAPN